MKRKWPRSSSQCRRGRLSRANAGGLAMLAATCEGVVAVVAMRALER
ncbi:hypothetical protein SNOG_15848 [Parastagonospora nodorum SN15]|uniref:Uncharacterized protein n=1 Tax=Phaeosphaeria nodorum (strain SN15 / ATCC MYA-4574 / FGSC 10173) TaxID=321614 RepID=Q0TX33_PHANO|nr:hypothetical protein SNOG_15848 [Parastagonospora nodorum SN15]EAT76686.1 hypothetical protein SNOG_15848 [Parastagonospora nodorum SN15]